MRPLFMLASLLLVNICTAQLLSEPDLKKILKPKAPNFQRPNALSDSKTQWLPQTAVSKQALLIDSNAIGRIYSSSQYPMPILQPYLQTPSNNSMRGTQRALSSTTPGSDAGRMPGTADQPRHLIPQQNVF
jgi:hypothetical protein